MLIHQMSQQDCIDLLERAHLGRLACVRGAQPYVTPAFFAFEEVYLYSFATVGQKIRWMRANPFVCVEFDEVVSAQHWSAVIVLGTYEELPCAPEHDTDRTRAYELLQKRPIWWEPAYVMTTLNGEARPLEAVYFRIHIDEISGRRGLSDAVPPVPVRQRRFFSRLAHIGSMRWGLSA